MPKTPVSAVKVAVKVPKPEPGDKLKQLQNRNDLLREAALMAQFTHPNVVALLGVVTSRQKCSVVLAHCAKGSLDVLLRMDALNDERDTMPPDTALNVGVDVAAGCAYLASKRFVHRDLSSRNILVTAADRFLVADFGMSRAMRADADYYKVRDDVALPVRWSAPEVIGKQQHTSASDVWSFFVLMWETWSRGQTPFSELTNGAVHKLLLAVAGGSLSPFSLPIGHQSQPAAVSAEIYTGLQQLCWQVDPLKRKSVDEIMQWIEDHRGVPSSAQADFHVHVDLSCAQILRDLSGGGYDVLMELEQVGEITVYTDTKETLKQLASHHPGKYTSAAYERLAKAAEDARRHEGDIVDALDDLAISTKLQEATRELHRHSTSYVELFDRWRGCTWPLYLKEVHAVLVDGFGDPSDPVLQPNPWHGEGIFDPSSKRYLSRLIEVFSSNCGINPVDTVAAACKHAIGSFGTAVKLLQGPPKKEPRIMEKARDCTYDGIRDYGRLSLIVEDTTVVPQLVQQLGDCPEFELVRATNRLDPDHDAHESAGYRDYQLLARVVETEWIVEIQVIPGEMHVLKSTLGHTGYAKYRFILEACRRAKARLAATSKAPLATNA